MMRNILFTVAIVLASANIAHADDEMPGPIPADESAPPAIRVSPPAGPPAIKTAVDPVTSMPSLAFAPGIAAPSLDVLAASLVLSDKGAAVRGVFAPFAFANKVPRVIADTRVEFRGQTDFAKPWGLTISTGYSPATDELRMKLGDETAWGIAASCATHLNEENAQKFKAAVKAFETAVAALDSGPTDVLEKASSTQDAAVKLYIRWQNVRKPKSTSQEQKKAADAAADVAKLEDSLLDAPRGECAYKRYALARMKNVYSNGWTVRIEGSVDFFPYIEGPKVRPAEGEPAVAPVKHAISGFGVGASGIWFPSRNSRVSATLSYSSKRATVKTDDPQRRVAMLVETAHNIAMDDIEVSGFQKGIAGGLQFGLQHCLEDGGCDDPVPLYDKSKTTKTLMLGAFVDFRAAEKLQFRIGLPLSIYTFASAPALSDGGLLAWSFSPTFSITGTKWVL